MLVLATADRSSADGIPASVLDCTQSPLKVLREAHSGDCTDLFSRPAAASRRGSLRAFLSRAVPQRSLAGGITPAASLA
jgi:hypothetical protein